MSRTNGWAFIIAVLAIDVGLLIFGGALLRVIGALVLIAVFVVVRALNGTPLGPRR